MVAQNLADMEASLLAAIDLPSDDSKTAIRSTITKLPVVMKALQIEELPVPRITYERWIVNTKSAAAAAQVHTSKDTAAINGWMVFGISLLSLPLLLSRFATFLPAPLQGVASMFLSMFSGRSITQNKAQDRVLNVLDEVKQSDPDNPIFPKLSEKIAPDQKAYIKARKK